MTERSDIHSASGGSIFNLQFSIFNSGFAGWGYPIIRLTPFIHSAILCRQKMSWAMTIRQAGGR
jgi:hypothetical protein